MTPKDYIKYMQEKDDGKWETVYDIKPQMYYKDKIVNQFEFWSQTEALLEAIDNGEQEN